MRNINRHHTFWEKRAYKTHTERTFRNLGGLVIPMLITDHRQLHYELDPPKKPRREMMDDVIDLMRGNEYEGVEGVILAQDYFDHVAETDRSDQRARLAYGIANHLDKQLVFMEVKVS